MKKILLALKTHASSYPPFISVVISLERRGFELAVVCESWPTSVRLSESTQIIQVPRGKPWKFFDRIRRAFYFATFRITTNATYNKFKPNYLWIGSADTGWILSGSRAHRESTYVVHNMELHDDFRILFWLTGRIARRAKCVVACEFNRAWFVKSWYHLPNRPYVLVNRPLPQLIKLGQDGDEDLAVKKYFFGKFVVFFQGHLNPDRFIIENIIKAVDYLGQDWAFIAIGGGKPDFIRHLKASYSSFTHLGYFAAPNHLKLTRLAQIGVVVYDKFSLNSLYCAPNKTWEYAAYGLPMICNDIPGLQGTVLPAHAGICVDVENTDKVIIALREIRDNYKKFSLNSSKMYEHSDYEAVFDRITDDLQK